MNPTTESNTAPTQRRTERRGQISVPYTKRYPEVRGGICEYCGVLDKNQPATMQYKMCPHYRGVDLRCSYCDISKDPTEVIGRSVMNVYDHPTDRDEQGNPVLVVVCDSYTCTQKHQARFTLSR